MDTIENIKVVRNKRINGDMYENEKLCCDICHSLSSYLSSFTDPTLPNYNVIVCKTCLTKCVEEIDNAILKDMSESRN